MNAKQLSIKEKNKIDKMSREELGENIMRVNPKSAKFSYSIKRFVRK